MYIKYLDVHSFTNFISHGRTRINNSFNFKTPFCKTSTFQVSYLNPIVKLWSYPCSIAPSSGFSSPLSFQVFVKQTPFDRPRTSFDIDWPCTWTLVKTCLNWKNRNCRVFQNFLSFSTSWNIVASLHGSGRSHLTSPHKQPSTCVRCKSLFTFKRGNSYRYAQLFLSLNRSSFSSSRDIWIGRPLLSKYKVLGWEHIY